eukprot:TRINITY_DN5802_c1_g1_i2.p1 TRINITY_DN5802_c1_g1~~TRINITY_DN5802_c1_g1_i2.p1  ORF type:complete len:683 (+),score=211.03 TRINITY_DN5802_c1_g1_i2:132-2180(+)
MKIIDKIKDTLAHERIFYSFEFFPPKTDAGTVNLYARIERMKELQPAFVGVTCDPRPPWESTIEICSTVQNLIGVETQMHICCGSATRQELEQSVRRAREAGVQNLFVLRGPRPRSGEPVGMGVAECIRWLRKEHGDYFGISVAGYADGHEESRGPEEDIAHLKEKVRAGADLVITQAVYDADTFLQFEANCKRQGIQVPIIPGVMPINTHHQFARQMRALRAIPSYRQTAAVQSLQQKLDDCRHDDSEVKRVGMQELAAVLTKLIRRRIRGFHFFTHNLESGVGRLLTCPPPNGLGLLGDEPTDLPYGISQTQRGLPWRQSANNARMTEDVRPAFWANRPKSYIARTSDWDDFPNGRWGDSRSPAFGDLDYSGTVSENAREWLNAKASPWPRDVTGPLLAGTFVAQLYDETPTLPWFETGLSSESTRGGGDSILTLLLDPMNRHGLLTINSQPPVNAEPSHDRTVGWGPPNGYVFQKEYVEFFCAPELAKVVLAVIGDSQKYKHLTWFATNRSGSECSFSGAGTNAVTWGVFPGKEIVQPTVVDPESFRVWRQEAFDLWLVPFRPGQEQFCPAMIQEVVSTWWLINIVDNDFVLQTELRTAMQEVCSKIPALVPPGELPPALQIQCAGSADAWAVVDAAARASSGDTPQATPPGGRLAAQQAPPQMQIAPAPAAASAAGPG